MKTRRPQLLFARVWLTPIEPEDLVDGETVYYTCRFYSDHSVHGPFRYDNSHGIPTLVNAGGVPIELVRFGNVIALWRPGTNVCPTE